jgi:RND family efflux transporter MFP subunit
VGLGGLLGASLLSASLLAGCGQNNTYVEPPPPEVVVAQPVQRPVTRYFETTGNAAPVNSANLVARVQGFVQEINYQDGAQVKKGAPLFTIEPEPYRLKLQQAQAAERAAQATATQTQAEFDRQSELVNRQAASKAALDNATANRDAAQAKLLQAQADTRQAQINLDYTRVVAPFDGVVTARQVSIGELVGGSGASVLATIVQLDPIYVNFSASERDVLRVRAEFERRGMKGTDIKGSPVEIGLQTDTGYPYKGVLDYIAPSINQATGTLALRATLANPKAAVLPGYFLRIRVPLDTQPGLLVPDVALGADQSGRYVLVVDAENKVEQREVTIGPLDKGMRVIDAGLKADDRVIVAGLLRALPGQKVAPRMQTAAATAPDTAAAAAPPPAKN